MIDALPVWLKVAGDQSSLIAIHAQPGASRSEISGVHGEALKIRIQARPIEGAANAALLTFLAKRLGLPTAALELIAGETSRTKRVRIPLAANTVLARLEVPLKAG